MKSEKKIIKRFEEYMNWIKEINDTESLQFHRTVAKRDALQWVLGIKL